MFRIARAGIFPRSWLLGAGSWGSGNLERVGQTGSVYKQPETEVNDSCHSWRVPSKWKVTQRGHKGEARGNLQGEQGEMRHVYIYDCIVCAEE